MHIREDITNAVMLNVVCAAARRHSLDANKLSISEVKQKSNDKNEKYTIGVLSSGGCLDTIASITHGFRPIFGTEICDKKRAMWRDATASRDLGDTFEVDWSTIPSPDLLSSGQTCIDYSSSGPRTGENGETGWMFTAQVDPILALAPKSFVLEMVGNALRVNRGREVRKVVTRLSADYHVKQQVIKTAAFGDGSNRTRLFIVGFSKMLPDVVKSYEFPTGSSAENVQARAYAEPDDTPCRFAS